MKDCPIINVRIIDFQEVMLDYHQRHLQFKCYAGKRILSYSQKTYLIFNQILNKKMYELIINNQKYEIDVEADTLLLGFILKVQNTGWEFSNLMYVGARSCLKKLNKLKLMITVIPFKKAEQVQQLSMGQIREEYL